MSPEEKLELIKRNAVEILNEKELSPFLKRKNLSAYCGYEPSGQIHLGHLVTIMKLLDLQRAGITPVILLADWHAWLNKKGSWKEIEEQVKSWEKAFKAAGLTRAKFVKGSSFQTKQKYIEDVLKLSLEITLSRGLRSMEAIARELENAKISQMFYPLMQIVDIKSLEIDIALGGMEQRKVHVLAMETLKKIKAKKNPVFIHTGIITSLKGPGSKMSSSMPESMISILDSPKEIENKIKKAHCVSGQTSQNPILEITRYLLFPKFEKIEIKRRPEHGRLQTYTDYVSLEKDFAAKKLHPLDLKNAVAFSLNELLAPIRNSWK